MRKSLIIISIVLFFVLLVAVELFVRSDGFAAWIRPYVVEPLKASLGEGVEIGRVEANFIPLYLELRDASIPDARGKQLFAARKIKVYINPLPLLRKKIRLSSISLIEPRVYVERASDGVINLMPLVGRIKSDFTRPPSEAPSRFSVLLRSITVRNGQIVFADNVTSSQLSVTGVNMAARIDLPQERVKVVVRSSQVRISAPAYPELSGGFKAALEYYRGSVRVDSAELSTVDASLTVSGGVGISAAAPLDLEVHLKSGPKTIRRFTDFLKPAQKQEASRIEARALVGGTASDPVIDGGLKVASLSFRGMLLRDAAVSFTYRNSAVSLRGEKWKLSKGDTGIIIDGIDAVVGYRRGGGMDIERFDVRAADLSLRLKGRADPSTGFDASLSVESTGKGQALSFFTPLPIEGAIGVSGRVSGALTSPRFEGTLAAGPVIVRGIPFSDVRGGMAFDGKKLSLSSVDIRERSSRYVFEGTADFSDKEPVYAARLRVVRSDVVNIVALFYRHLPLRLSAEGELSFAGTARNYSGSGYLTLASGSAYGETFTRGTITAKLSTGRIAFPQVIVYKERGMAKANGWIGFDGTYSADLESRDVDLSAVDYIAGMPFGGAFALDLHSSGSFSHPYVKASLEVDDLSYHQAPAGGMDAEMEIKDGLFTLDAALSEERAALSIRWDLHKPYAWTAEARVKSDEIDPFLVLGNKGPSGVKVIADGRVTAHARGMDVSSLTGEAVFQKLSLVIGDYRIDNESDARLSVDAGRIAAASLNFTGPGTRIGVTGGARLLSEVDATLKGTADLSLLKLLYREVEHAGGAAAVKLTIKDDWKNPDVAGELRVQNGEIKVKDVPQRFSALNGRIVFSQGRIVADSVTGEMGGGTLNVSGWAQLAGVSLQDFSAKVALDNVTVRYPEGLVSTLSGDLYYDGDASEQSLSGEVAIRRARYDKRIEWKTMLVDIGRGLYQKKKTDVGWIGDTRINVRFHGTDNILFQNNLAVMPLDVDVFLRGTVNHPYLLGRIEARKGTVYFRKNEFKILNASADFVDPGRMNPVLDIQAETRVREYQIRLAVTGTAERAVVTLISEPSLIDTDILSLLALGKKGSELKGKEAGVGMGEAASFATGQFQDIFERRARSLTGLDRFQVDPYVGKSDTSVPRVTVGKELVQNKLFVTYSSNVGASAPEQIFRIEYLLNRHFSLVGERNETGNTGADIKYRFEFK